MSNDRPYQAFQPPDPSSLVSIRSIGHTTYAELLVPTISSVEVGAIREALWHVIESAPEGLLRHVVLNMENVTFVNSEAIGMIVATHSKAGQHGAKLILGGVTELVLETLSVTRLLGTLQVCTTSAQLEKALGQ